MNMLSRDILEIENIMSEMMDKIPGCDWILQKKRFMNLKIQVTKYPK